MVIKTNVGFLTKWYGCVEWRFQNQWNTKMMGTILEKKLCKKLYRQKGEEIQKNDQLM